MEDSVIKVNGLGKRYQIRHGGQKAAHSLREALPQALHSLMHPFKFTREASEDFWALRDVSFEIKRGECVGIIGRNGAGKSTLLKILSRITEPTTGRIELHGRVGSLLEVGTGFHQELTGRENIYLNGTILGMKKKEIDRKFDEIVAFSEIEKFLDTPVKRYSSGMYVRLAFAVAAHLEPEILIIDEVLAVGDVQFQKKCLGKMGDVAKEGRTVIFVSHNMGAIRQLCSRGIYLLEGRVDKMGDIDSVIERYLHGHSDTKRMVVQFLEDVNKLACILKVAVTCPQKAHQEALDINDSIEIHVEYMLRERMSGVNLAMMVLREGAPVLTSFDIDMEELLFVSREAGCYRARIQIPAHILKAGGYTVLVDLGRPGVGVIDQKPEALVFDIGDAGEDTTHKGYAASRLGVLAIPLPWNTQRV